MSTAITAWSGRAALYAAATMCALVIATLSFLALQAPAPRTSAAPAAGPPLHVHLRLMPQAQPAVAVAQRAIRPKMVPLTGAARATAARFVASAVLRRHLRDSWRIVAPRLRGAVTKAQWLTGDIPVVPYLAQRIRARYTLIHRHPKHLLVAVDLTATAAERPPESFLLELVLQRSRWLVVNWVPAVTITGASATT